MHRSRSDAMRSASTALPPIIVDTTAAADALAAPWPKPPSRPWMRRRTEA